MTDRQNPYYRGPVSDHFDGVRFFTPGHRVVNCTSDLLKWQFSGERKEWPKKVENKPAAAPAASVPVPDLRITFIGHATTLIQTAGLNILTDPLYSERTSPFQFAGPKRVRAPGVHMEDLPRLDAIFVSHNHYDHMDLPALKKLARHHRCRIVTPLGNAAVMGSSVKGAEVTEADWHEPVSLASDVTLTPTPAMHWSKRTFFDRNMALWSAFVLEAPGGPIYFAADTGYGTGDHFRDVRERYGTPRAALIPIGAYEPRWFMKAQHMNPEEAVMACRDLGTPHSIGIHHSTVQLTDEAIDDPIRELGEALKEQGVDTGHFRTLDEGHAWDIPALETTSMS